MSRPRIARGVVALCCAVVPLFVFGGADAQTQQSNTVLGPPIAVSGGATGGNVSLGTTGPQASGLSAFTTQTGDNFVAVDQALVVSSGSAVSGATVDGTPIATLPGARTLGSLPGIGVLSGPGTQAGVPATSTVSTPSGASVKAPALQVSSGRKVAAAGTGKTAGVTAPALDASNSGPEAVRGAPASTSAPGPAVSGALAALSALGGGLAAGRRRSRPRRGSVDTRTVDLELGASVNVPSTWASVAVTGTATVLYDPASSPDGSPDQATAGLLCLRQRRDAVDAPVLRSLRTADGQTLQLAVRDLPVPGGRVRLVAYGLDSDAVRTLVQEAEILLDVAA